MKWKDSILALFLGVFLNGCEETPIPKPLGYYRIDFPEKDYIKYHGTCPFSFSYPKRSLLDTNLKGKPACWMNLHYPQYMATVHLTYSKMKAGELNRFMEDARKMAMKHIVKADDIEEELIARKDANVFGVSYDFEGNTATNYQFFLTDSTTHFIRGSLYFNLVPNADSIEPVANFIKEDVRVLINSLQWIETDAKQIK